jgi:hypothetical protein
MGLCGKGGERDAKVCFGFGFGGGNAADAVGVSGRGNDSALLLIQQ